MNRVLATDVQWRVGDGVVLHAVGVPLLMAIVNTTPDSFSDGGLYADPECAAQHALACVAAGAALVDVGGESTRPGAHRVSEAEQIARTVPVIRAIAGRTTVSIDTTRAAVARAAIHAGARIVNDVSAGTEDPEILEVAASTGAGLVLMHRLLPPDQDRYSHEHDQAPHYDDVVRDVRDWLLERASVAQRAGVAREAIALDPGLGFGKNVEQNLELIARVQEIAAEGYPVVIGASRKSFVGAITGAERPTDRVAGSVGVALAAAARGAAVLRVHDVAAHHHALTAWSASGGAGPLDVHH